MLNKIEEIMHSEQTKAILFTDGQTELLLETAVLKTYFLSHITLSYTPILSSIYAFPLEHTIE